MNTTPWELLLQKILNPYWREPVGKTAAGGPQGEMSGGERVKVG